MLPTPKNDVSSSSAPPSALSSAVRPAEVTCAWGVDGGCAVGHVQSWALPQGTWQEITGECLGAHAE
eukprot:365310-Chlamydomonas_euryale.AAC.3